jgi:hypothetical protein
LPTRFLSTRQNFAVVAAAAFLMAGQVVAVVFLRVGNKFEAAIHRNKPAGMGASLYRAGPDGYPAPSLADRVGWDLPHMDQDMNQAA